MLYLWRRINIIIIIIIITTGIISMANCVEKIVLGLEFTVNSSVSVSAGANSKHFDGELLAIIGSSTGDVSEEPLT